VKSDAAKAGIFVVVATAALWSAWVLSKGGEPGAGVATPAVAEAPAATQVQRDGLQVDVSGVRDDQGWVVGSLCAEGEAFPAGCTRQARTKAANGVVTLAFPELKQGRYALALYHDENSDSKLELGKEGVGFSNNANLAYAAPEFAASAIEVEGNTRIRVRIRYSF
jgi:uncharacterized protein (DUF2141 family)